MTAPAAQTRDLGKRYAGDGTEVVALDGVALRVDTGDFLAVMGASGSGKSTLLHLLAGLDVPDTGSVCIAGQDLAGLDDAALTRFRRRRIGVVFQAFNLMPVLDARENTALPLLLDGVARAEALDRADAALAEVDLSARRAHRPDQLSGGEQQRLAVARALITDPALILTDEPTGNLDSVAADRVMALLGRLHAQRGRSIVLITHEARIATCAARVAVLADGRLCGAIDGDEVRDPTRLAQRYLALTQAKAGSA